MVLLLSPEVLVETIERQLELPIAERNASPETQAILYAVIDLFNISYGIAALLRIKRFQKLLKNKLSTFSRSNIRWLQNIVISWLVLFTVPSIIVVFILQEGAHNASFELVVDALRIGLAVLFSYQFVTKELITSEQASSLNYHVSPATLPEGSNAPTQYSANKEEAMYQQLVAHTLAQKLYEQTDITLNALANDFGEPPYRVSKLINDYSGGNYHDFINNFRIEAVKKDLLETSEQIIQIAYKNGFNSKSTFNQVFKMQVGVSPSLFRRKKLKD
ncbi:MAG: helix-turn-helix transcriptional regulator [Salibacteraceae bacterium]